jgi:hypothetical protein
MSHEIQLRLSAIRCNKASETEDEIYCALSGEYQASNAKINVRFPENNVWKLRSGQSVGPGTLLFDGEIYNGVTLNVKMIEEDGGGLTKILDDVVGELTLKVDANLCPDWLCDGKTTIYQGQNAGGEHLFHCTGAKADYVVAFRLFAKKPI